MKCPSCQSTAITTTQSRNIKDFPLPSQLYRGCGKRRRRICKDCGHRWTTIELSDFAVKEYVSVVRQTNEAYKIVMEKQARKTA